jgi:hypothetical protein
MRGNDSNTGGGMKKPEWFELIKNDAPIVKLKKNKAPLAVFVIIGLIVSLFLIVPPNSGNSPVDIQPSIIISPTTEPNAKISKTPISNPTIKNPSIGVMPSGNKNDDEENEEDDEENEDEDDD